MKMKELKTALKLALVSLAVIGLISCSTTKLQIAHDPLGCIEKSLTRLSDRFTDEELNNIPDNVFDTYAEHIIMYQERITSQCEINESHDKKHGDK